MTAAEITTNKPRPMASPAMSTRHLFGKSAYADATNPTLEKHERNRHLGHMRRGREEDTV
jgi:hypothetical protein